jgi:hypothetical protein
MMTGQRQRLSRASLQNRGGLLDFDDRFGGA